MAENRWKLLFGFKKKDLALRWSIIWLTKWIIRNYTQLAFIAGYSTPITDAITSNHARQSIVQSVEIIENLSAVLLVEPYKSKLQNVIQNNTDYAKMKIEKYSGWKRCLDTKWHFFTVGTLVQVCPDELSRYWESFLFHGRCYFPKETIFDCWAFEIKCYFILEYVWKEISFLENI